MKFTLLIISLILIIEFSQAQYLTYKSTSKRTVRGLIFRSDNKIIVTSDEQNILIWDPFKNVTSYSFKNANNADCCGFSYLNENGLLATASENIVNIWNLTDLNYTLIKSFVFVYKFFYHD